MFTVDAYIKAYTASPLGRFGSIMPWDLVAQAEERVKLLLSVLGQDYRINEGIAVHVSAQIETPVTIKAPSIIGSHVFIAAGSYLRGGVWLDEGCRIGPGVEIKSSFIFKATALAHFNYVGDSVIGEGVNFEAGSVIANHYNERDDKEISVRVSGALAKTGVQKFGALVGDGVRVGANSVLSPGTLLAAGTVVPRLALIDQDS